MTERERRQLMGMLTQFDAFDAGQLDIAGLISSLEALFSALEDASASWRTKFRKHWGVLEEVYAVAADEGRWPTSASEQHLIAEATQELKELVQETLGAEHWSCVPRPNAKQLLQSIVVANDELEVDELSALENALNESERQFAAGQGRDFFTALAELRGFVKIEISRRALREIERARRLSTILQSRGHSVKSAG
jgi:hypothetical protein